MNKTNLVAAMAILFSTPTFSAGMGSDDPLIYKVMIDKFEIRSSDGPNPLILDADAWIGKDLNKLWLKTEIERVDGETEEAEIQLLYSRAFAPFWDLQAGWRRDVRPEPEKDWLVVGVKGLAPYLFDVDASLFVGESGQFGARLDAEYEYMLTQRWVLSPELEMNLYAKDDEEAGVGSGLSDLSIGLRLAYEVRREFAPYVGVNWSKKYGDTANYARAEGEDIEDVQFVAGVRIWF